MELSLRPYKSVGEFEFNAKREIVRGFMKEHASELATHARTDGKVADDSYENLGLEFIYTKYDKLGAIELKSPSKLVFNGVNLMEKTWKELLHQFQMLDPEIQVSSKDFISYKFGVAVFAPNKDTNPNTLPTSITAFDKQFFIHKDGIADPQYLNTFHIHVPFFRAGRSEKSRSEAKSEGLKEAFSEVREKGIMIWNQVPIALDYASDLPEILQPILSLLEKMRTSTEGTHELKLACASFTTEWKVKWNEKFLLIDAHWVKVKGGYEDALNDTDPNIGQLTLVKSEFLSEWKMPLLQVWNALKHENVEPELSGRVRSMERSIKEMGKFYREDKSLISTTPDGRKKVDFTSMNQWKMLLFALIIIAIIIGPIAYFGFDTSTYWWVRLGRNIALVILIGIPVFLGLRALIRRKKR